MSILLAKRRRGIFLSLISGEEYKGRRVQKREREGGREGREWEREESRVRKRKEKINDHQSVVLIPPPVHTLC